ncbi:MAG: zinc ribbon domain-containing protein [Planctomycetota bacterium]
MPTYTYGPIGDDAKNRECEMCSKTFEFAQHMKDEILAKCPKCDGAIERIITAPNLGGVGIMAHKPSADNMAKAGFTQYKRHGKGYYEKQFGQGPPSLHGD